MTKKLFALGLIGSAALAVPTAASAGGSYGFSISTGPTYYPAPAPVYVAPPPPPPVYYYRPAPVYRPWRYHRPHTGFSFSYHGY